MLNYLFDMFIGELCVRWLLCVRFMFMIVLFGLSIVKNMFWFVCEFEFGCMFVVFVLNSCFMWLIVSCLIMFMYL